MQVGRCGELVLHKQRCHMIVQVRAMARAALVSSCLPQSFLLLLCDADRESVKHLFPICHAAIIHFVPARDFGPGSGFSRLRADGKLMLAGLLDVM